MAMIMAADEGMLTRAFAIIEKTQDIELVVCKRPRSTTDRSCCLPFLQIGSESASGPLHSPDLSCFLDQTLPYNGL